MTAIARKRSRSRRARPRGGPVAVTEFKSRCLELIDHVRETGTEYVVTKHGRPVATVSPYRPPAKGTLVGWMKGSVLSYDRPFDPLDADYDLDRD